jgi:hypothetical protein
VEISQLDGRGGDLAAERDLAHACGQERVAPLRRRQRQGEPPRPKQPSDLTDADRRDRELVAGQRLVHQRPSLRAKAGIGGFEPDGGLGVEQDQRCMSHSTS